MASKKKQDEKHLKVLREMVALAHNKQCFDCHQRGPTYINMTIGSYVCTACSGLLRGLNPPHRVKSISMASFTPDEIEFIKCHGNEYCRKVWLGLYDNRGSLTADGRDESKVKDFMTQKYERKRYYVAPTESMKDEAKSMNESAIASKVPGTKPLKSLLGENAPRIQVGNYQDEESAKTANPFEENIATSSAPPPVSADLFAEPTTQTTGQTATPNISDLFGASNQAVPAMPQSASNPFGLGETMPQNTATESDLFGGQVPASSSSSEPGNPFGNTPTSGTMFGNTPSTGNFPSSASSGDLFGNTPTSGNMFGNSTTSTGNIPSSASTGDLFGNAQSTVNFPSSASTGDLFGNALITGNIPSSSSSGDLFGNASSTGNIPSSASMGDLFGNALITGNIPSSSSSGNLFGNASSTGNLPSSASSGDLFGNVGNTVSPQPGLGKEVKAAATPPPIHSTPQSPGSTSIQSSKSSGSTAMDLLGDLGGDPFASSTPQSQSSSGGGFADFGNFGNTATSSQPSQPSAFPPSAPLQPAGSGSQPLFNGFGSTPASTTPAPAAPGAGGDKYSNLSDLFSTSSAEENTATSGWSTTLSSSSSGGGLNWGGGAQTSTSTSSGGLNWGGDGNSAGGGGGGVNWNSSSTQPAQPQGGMSWGGPSSASSSWGGAPATAQSNVSNPFGSSSATTLTSQSGFGQAGVPQQPGGGFGQPGFGQPGVPQQQSANPFGGQAVSSSGFGAFGAPNASVSQNAGFGQFGASTASSVGGFGQFGTPASTASAGFGQFGVQNGGFGANTPTTGFGGAQPTMSTGFGGQQGFGAGQQAFGQQAPQQQNAGFGGAGFGAQPTQGFPQQQPAGFGGQQAQMQGFGGAQGWGQQMPPSQGSANPFMSTAQQYSNTAPKAGATNPFL